MWGNKGGWEKRDMELSFTIEVSPGRKRLEKMGSNPNPLTSFGMSHCIII